VIWRLASSDSIDYIAVILNNIMQGHYGDRNHDAERDFKNTIPSLLSSGGNQGGVICIHHLGKPAEDAHQRTSDTGHACDNDFAMDVTINMSIPPRCDVVSRPD
jgi:hypothetical protein